MTYPAPAVPPVDRRTAIRRTAAQAMTTVASNADTAAFALGVAVAIASIGSIGSIGDLTAGATILLVLALYGAATVTSGLLLAAADAVDPDAADGDMLLEAGAIIADVRDDVSQGADLADVVRSIQLSETLPHLHQLLADIAESYITQGEYTAAAPVRDAADALASAVQRLGHGDL